LEGLTYSFRPDRKVFVAEMSGENRKYDQFKWRWEKQTILKEVPEEELKELLLQESKKVGYNLFEACFPLNPLRVYPREVTEKDIEDLKKWASVRTSVWTSGKAFVWAFIKASVYDLVGASVGDSVGDMVWRSTGASVHASVGDSIWHSIGALVYDAVGPSVWASVGASIKTSSRDFIGAYISSIFPSMKWKSIEHKEGENPFQPAIDLWRRGFVPSFDGGVWRLHQGEKAEVVYEWRTK